MSYLCAYCDADFSDNVMCPACVTEQKSTIRSQDGLLGRLARERDEAREALRLASRAISMGIGTHGEPCHNPYCRAIDEFKEALAAIEKALGGV